MFFDTDVLIWALRGHLKAEETIDQAPHILISAITYMELLQGARNRQEVVRFPLYVPPLICASPGDKHAFDLAPPTGAAIL
ncbi:PIN domain-containing protein [Candidatus Thiosymbion oneisti]|uniref:PIN domain-containing protein n=1 Tax=Candidatus Thiosymbion oneisti TaxID=589554 RepID=UPI00114C96D0